MTQKTSHVDSAALGRLRVLEVVDEVGELCGKMMADMGADVIRIEPPEGVPTRRIGPFLEDHPHPERSLHFWQYNMNKRSVTMNLDKLDGQAMFRRLVAGADIVIESMAPGYMDDRGLSYQRLRSANADLICVSISAFGRGGHRGDLRGGDLVGWAASGYMYTTGWTWQQPTRPWGRQASHAACLHALGASMAALFCRRRTGVGQHIDISMQEAVASMTEQNVPFYVGDNVISGRRANDHVNYWGSYKVIPCADGWVHLNIGWQEGRNPIVEWMAKDGMAGDLVDEKWLDRRHLRSNIDHVVELISAWARTKTKTEFFHEGQDRRMECGPVNSIPEVFDDLQLRHRGYWVDVVHPELGRTFTYPGAPYHFTETPWSTRRRAPLIGEDNAAIYEHELGISKTDLTVLAESGVV